MIQNYTKFIVSGCLIFGFTFSGFSQKLQKIQPNSSNATLRVTKNQTLKSTSQTQNEGSLSKPGKYDAQIQKIVNSYDQAKLAELKQQFQRQTMSRREKMLNYARVNNIPTEKVTIDGVTRQLQYIASDGSPIYYTTYNVDAAESTRTNHLNTGGSLGLNLNGDDLTAHVWDGGIARNTHQEYDGAGGTNRFSVGDGSGTADRNFHAAHVTGTIMASGVQAAAKGMAWQADAVGYDWNNDKAEATTAAANGMLVSNHSYGYGMRDQFGNPQLPAYFLGGYITESRDWDVIMNNAPYYMMVVAAGNDGQDDTANPSPTDGQSAYDKLSGHATTKNNIVVANAQDANISANGDLNSVVINSSSSEGPTDDYRIKPDITGNGTGVYSTYENSNTAYASITGTSMASPNVCGSLLLLQEHYNNVNGNFMRAATLKGLALHTADDAGPNGPDAVYGWGLMNAKSAAEAITNNSVSSIVEEVSLTNGQTYSITVQSDGVNPLQASISWNDPAGTATTTANLNTAVLVNDLDVRVDNGTSYEPWRLTGVTTNGTGDNTKDPFERVDVAGASGTYTITVTHKGTLSSAQDFSLIVTGVVVSNTPSISFASTTANSTESTDCSFTDVDVPLNIALAPSADGTVNFSIDGGTATQGVDYDLLTSSVTFPSGSTAGQNMTLRIYNDGFVEGDETIDVSFTVNDNGGDAEANTNRDSMTLTINDDDVVPASTQTVNIVSYDMEDLTGWGTYNADGDAYNWFGASGPELPGVVEGNFLTSETDLTSFDNGDGATGTANPNQYIITPVMTIPATGTNVEFSFGIGSIASGEHWAAYWFTDYTVDGITNGATLIAEGDTTANTAGTVVANLAGIEGQTGYFTIRHFNSNGNSGYLIFDTLSVSAITSVDVQTAVNSGTNDTVSLPGAGTIYTSDSSSGDLMLNITNNNSHDYGCVDVHVSRAGTSAQAYNGSASPNFVTDKTFTVATGNAATSQDASVTFYFTEAEISGWETATGLNRSVLTVLRDNGGSSENVTTTIGAFGTHVTLTSNFTGLAGTYYFGPADAFGVQLQPKVFLQGAAINPDSGEETLMRDDLRDNGSIPTTSPYDATTINASVLTTTGANAIVDWVQVELRDSANSATIIATQSALVQRDGDVVGRDGSSALTFAVSPGNYYVTIKHRNHLGIMSANVVTLSSIPTSLDFTTSISTALGGTNAVVDLGDGRLAMFGGDFDDNSQIQVADSSGVAATLGGSGYSVSDVDMNGQIQVSDITGIIYSNIGKGQQF